MASYGKILSLLRTSSAGYISGQEISNQLHVSRAAVWKQIKVLRELGFEVESKHSQGYRLLSSPDILLAAEIENELNCSLIGRSVVSFPVIDSTNVQARRLADEGALEGTVVVADQQSAGRGRLGRRWESPFGVNLYCSIILRPDIPVQQAPQLTFLSAVAVAETLNEICNLTAEVKWPNDILVNGAKISGLLNEMSAETEQIHFVILGVGINLNMAADQFPRELNYPVTSVLLATEEKVDRLLFLRTFLQRLDACYAELLTQGFAPVRRRWESLCNVINRQVDVDLGAEVLRGTVVGLDPEGALRLQLENGEIKKILAGDVRPVIT
ncbi:BirA family transcriptional regulator, biotin operon repressor / biotin-[acetyl-CoA-carboxylase] ligase [Desulfuromusa kysingii]|uniref:Bifunctional ligase/repressor BirA n=1 Tax=Desulfuromusa kysingii TaxID=37625 RepID=A0A1H4BZF6_9BACT|nr:biotin--[acetyl-CoA-carboxylase] ligase [Desulfuromusa kysingii]SEA53450.1 BirA family transcriptional regulator, biotin operon repressor / biotin-[acetyl-CoA-carboxylase] ligase [Desulfuromusa kysingii]